MPRLELRLTLQTKQILTQCLKLQLRQSLVPRLTLLTRTDEQDKLECKFLKRLLNNPDPCRYVASNKSRSINRKLDRCMKCGADIRQVLQSAIGAPHFGFGPFLFVSMLATTAGRLQKSGATHRFLQLMGLSPTDQRSWECGVACDVLAFIYELLPVLSSPAVLSQLLERLVILIRSEPRYLSQVLDARLFKELLLDKKLDDTNIGPLFTVVQESLGLMPPILTYWQPRRAQQIGCLLANPSFTTTLERIGNASLVLGLTGYVLLSEGPELDSYLMLIRDEYIAKSIDAKRSLLGALVSIETDRFWRSRATEILKHIMTISANGRDLVHVLRLVALQITTLSEYPFEAASSEALTIYLRERISKSFFEEIGLEGEERQMLINDLGRLNRRNLLTALVELSANYRRLEYTKGLELIRTMLLRLHHRSFGGFRYVHEQAEGQMAMLADREAWVENTHTVKHVGDVSAIRGAIAAVQDSVPPLRSAIASAFSHEWKSTAHVQKAYDECIDLVKSTSGDAKRDAIKRKERAEAAYAIYSALNVLQRLTIDQFLGLEGILNRAVGLSRPWPAIHQLLADVISIRQKYVDSKTFTRVTIVETDDAVDLINIGVRPVSTCQSWTGPVSNNRALLAYVLDANKKLFLIHSDGGTLTGRTIVRLVGLAVKENVIPGLLVERPYSLAWSDDIARCVLQVITSKAKSIALRNGGICGVAVSELDGKNTFRAILESEVGSRGKELLHYDKAFALPSSINGFEYSDALGGLLESGTTVEAKLVVFFVTGQ